MVVEIDQESLTQSTKCKSIYELEKLWTWTLHNLELDVGTRYECQVYRARAPCASPYQVQGNVDHARPKPHYPLLSASLPSNSSLNVYGHRVTFLFALL